MKRSMASRLLKAKRLPFIAGSLMTMLVLLVVVFGPLVAPVDPAAIDTTKRLTPPAWAATGTFEHLLGTDHLGRDVLSRSLHATRVSFLITVSAVLVSAAVGITLGLLAGYSGGAVGAVIMRLADVQYSFPFIVLAIAIIATFGATLVTVTATLAAWGWAVFARVTQAETIVAVQREYVAAAQALGSGAARVIFRHILPNILSPLIVIATASIAQVLVAESALSFLGLGVPPSVPSLGTLIGEGRTYFAIAYWTITFPGLMIALMVFGVNLLGDSVRDFLDPRMNG